MTHPVIERLKKLRREHECLVESEIDNDQFYPAIWGIRTPDLDAAIAEIAAMLAEPVTVRVLVNVVWRPYETHKIHDGYGGFSGESVDGEFHAFFNDGSSLVWRYSPEVKHECWMDTGWPGIIPLRNESEVPDAEK